MLLHNGETVRNSYFTILHKWPLNDITYYNDMKILNVLSFQKCKKSTQPFPSPLSPKCFQFHQQVAGWGTEYTYGACSNCISGILPIWRFMAVTLHSNSATSKSGAKAWVTEKATAVWIKYGCFNTFLLDVKKVKGCCFHTMAFRVSVSSSVKIQKRSFWIVTVQKGVMGGGIKVWASLHWHCED